MGRAYGEEERETIRKALMDTAIELFHENGTKTLSIRELTKRVGISQGGFYNFWEDKDALVTDLMKYRSEQKLGELEKHFSEALSDPAAWLSETVFYWCKDMMVKIDTKPIYRENLDLLLKKDAVHSPRIDPLYGDFLRHFSDFLKEHQCEEEVDVSGLIVVLTGVGIFLQNSGQFDRERFYELLKAFLDSSVRLYVRAKK